MTTSVRDSFQSRLEIHDFDLQHRLACLALFDSNCPSSFALVERAEYEAFLHSRGIHYRVGVLDGVIVAGFAVVDEGIPRRRRLNWIIVSPGVQGSGVGSDIMREAIAQARHSGADHLDIATSQKAQAFFARWGARIIKVQMDGWAAGFDKVEMEVPISVAGAPRKRGA